MYIAPNTTIKLLMNVPLKSDYNETFWWSGELPQQQYFLSKAIGTFTSQSYQRTNRDYCRIEAKYSQVYKCNYMMFLNASHENKYFYAFINDITYINENVVEIDYTIDVIQTWFFDIVTKECFVEREHTTTDNIGDNLVPESFDLGDYIIGSKIRSGLMNKWAIIIASTLDPDYHPAVGNMYGGVYSGLNLIAFDEDHVGSQQANYIEAVITYIEEATQDHGKEAINNVFMMPSFFVPEHEWAAGWTPTQDHDTFVPNHTEFLVTPQAGNIYDNYTVLNNKLYTYPYNFLYVYASSGVSGTYPYEYFELDTNGKARFDIVGNYSTNPEVAAVPKFYKGDAYNVDESLRMTVGTQCAWTCDAFDAWQAYLGAYVPDLAMSGLQVLNGYVTANPVTAARGMYSLANQITGIVSSGVKSYIDPPQKQGNSDGNLLMSNSTQDFYFVNKHIRREFAEIIDSYFQRFGYACKKVKLPNLHARQKWTYVKTVGCDFEGNIPVSDMVKIREIFDNGIAIWADTANIGNYSLTNAVLGA